MQRKDRSGATNKCKKPRRGSIASIQIQIVTSTITSSRSLGFDPKSGRMYVITTRRHKYEDIPNISKYRCNMDSDSNADICETVTERVLARDPSEDDELRDRNTTKCHS